MMSAREGLIVAAGFGSRMQSLAIQGKELIKPLHPVAGVPLLKRVLDRSFACGLDTVHLVVGFMARELTAEVRTWHLAGDVDIVFNPDFHLDNGVSLYHGARRCKGDFVLLMSDHLFQARNLEGLLNSGRGDNQAVLAVDYKIRQVFDLDDATRVLTQGDKIVSIGKKIEPYNCVDTGMFLLSQAVTSQLEQLIAERGDASISDAMRGFVARGAMGAYDIGPGVWQDVDDPSMYANAEKLVAEGIL